MGHLLTWIVPLSVSYHFAFSYCSWGSQGKNIEVVCHSLIQWTTFCQTSPPWPVHLGWPHTAWLSFIELDKAVVLVWLDWLVFCDYGFSVSALWCPLASPTVLLGFSYLGSGKIQNSPNQASPIHELPDGQAGFRKGRGTRDQIANIRWIMEKEREFQKNIYFCFIDYAKAFDCVDQINCGKFWKRWEYQNTWSASWETCMQVRKQQLELDMEQQTGSK